MLLIDSRLVRSRAGAIVGGLDDEKVHAEEDRDEDQCRDTERCLERNVLNDSTGDCLARIGSVRRCDEPGGETLPEKHTGGQHAAPDCDPSTSLMDKVHVRHCGGDKCLERC